MSLRSVIEEMRASGPRSLVALREELGKDPPLGRRAIGPAEAQRRLAPVVPYLADGRVPLEPGVAPTVAQLLEGAWDRAVRRPPEG